MAHEVHVLVVVGLLVSLFGVQRGDAVDFGFGACPDKNVVQSFDASRYSGQWYELERYWVIFEVNGKCAKAQYSFNSTTGQVSVKNSMVDIWTKQDKSIEGYAVLTNPSARPVEAKLTLTFKIPVVGEQKSPYWVLDTDYDNYALVYSCSSGLNIFRAETAWILARVPVITDASIQKKIEDAIVAAGLNRASFLKTPQDCEKQATIEAGTATSPSKDSA